MDGGLNQCGNKLVISDGTAEIAMSECPTSATSPECVSSLELTNHIIRP